MSKTDLVIVESPAKAKTIGKYLGNGYRVVASMGHLRDLPGKRLGIDVARGFEPEYEKLPGREEIVSNLDKAIRDSEYIYLATDPDREGEAISWHIKELFSLPEDRIRRVTFNEITRKVVLESINSPRAIDTNLVDAQQARRVLDRIVGFMLSPLLWKKVQKGLSAGRVQSVATRMVVRREEEIRSFVPREYWSIEAKLKAEQGEFSAKLVSRDASKYEPASLEESEKVLSELAAAEFSVAGIKTTEKKRQPAAPFITSTLQQEASRTLNMTPKRTMAIAQQLYEGIDVANVGTIGLITYMRTDSQRISEEALAGARNYIVEKYGRKYYGAPRTYKSRGGAQDAHEAIRPTDAALDPDSIKESLTGDQYRLYRIIWSRFIASQMVNAVYDSVSVEVEAGRYGLRTSRSRMKFDGFTRVYEEGRDEENGESGNLLPELAAGEALTLLECTKEQHFTMPPSRYTEATLVKAMEEYGIGRPSTYAATISTILDREYVKKEGKTLCPTPLGEVVDGLMSDKFKDIVDTEFTARMENELDRVEEGSVRWKQMLEEFYGPFEANLKKAEQELQGVRLKVPDEISDEVCEDCGVNLVVKKGKFGKFLACPNFPKCHYTKPIVVEMPGVCPSCGGRILKKSSRKGYAYYGCDKYPACTFMTWDVPVKENCPVCGHTLFKKSGRGHKKPFCINQECSAFLPEDKRGGYKKKEDKGDAPEKKSGAKQAAKAEKDAKTAKTEKDAKTAKAAKAGTQKAAKTKTSGGKSPAKKTAAKGTGKKSSAKSEE